MEGFVSTCHPHYTTLSLLGFASFHRTDLLTAVHSEGLTSLHLNPSLPSLALCILQSDSLKHPRPPGITCSLSLCMQTLA